MKQILQAEKEDVNKKSRASAVARSKRLTTSAKVGVDTEDDGNDDDFMPGSEVVETVSEESDDDINEASISNKEVRNGKSLTFFKKC
jgi:hypothetical protein